MYEMSAPLGFLNTRQQQCQEIEVLLVRGDTTEAGEPADPFIPSISSKPAT
jgi:hypothetical protein